VPPASRMDRLFPDTRRHTYPSHQKIAMASNPPSSPPRGNVWPPVRKTESGEPFTLTCHCGRVSVTVPTRPQKVNECRCSICYRYGVLWAYYLRREVVISPATADGESVGYVRSDEFGDGDLGFFRCRRCGCVTHWEGVVDTPKRKGPEARMGVNWRMAGVGGLEGVERVVTQKLKDRELGAGAVPA